MDEALPTRPNQQQLSLASLLWVTVASAMLLAYAKNLGSSTLVMLGFYTAFVFVCSLIAGQLSGKFADAFYWSSLVSLLAFLAVAGGTLPDPSIGIGWGLVGAACGVSVGLGVPRNMWLGIVFAAILGLLSMLVVVACHRVRITELIAFDVGCAALVGALLRPFVDFLRWFESRSGNPRLVLAAWLAICVMVGNMLVPILAGTHR